MAKPKDFKALIEVTKTTQTLITHFKSSLAPSTATPSQTQAPTTDLPNPLDAIKASTTLLKSHTTTLSLLLLTPPLTPSALITKIGDVNSGALSGMVAAATYIPQAGEKDDIGNMMRTELRSRVRQLVGTWGDVLTLVLRMAESRQNAKGKDAGPSESEKQDVLSATGVLWEACEVVLKACNDGVVGLVVRKATELRATLLDAIEELKEWGEDIEDENDEAAGSDDEDEMFGAMNKLGKDDKELKELLDVSVKKLKMVGMLYQALIKRRLKTYPAPSAATSAISSPGPKLDELMALVKAIPESVDDLANAFYSLDEESAKELLEQTCKEAKRAAEIVKQNWAGTDDEFTTWSGKWAAALDAA
ncbi:hypothetical protein HBI56_048720 [Parastagonospora nodorum]|uniref:Cyclin-D1-binding protein 1-like N-terminal domain-containing protein n=2 Tax=Phaeosphaeria nodorum (strain SN15 / ATCC MYA-4574 / FGSC 10173) TaxID=321614 RepID=A0A7U2HU62_PHANO|nr:hypothetical protein SNOG_02160 [Parastagonospora nodorum SN15]KAH3916671.1 hypothetical protein HBH56_061640 [Parastagonospora nodorum]EAT90372.1 hypothetical protein SNOG_02160 [Parastagonospora nodorum SN15]KAH3930804.1 hypothetical protein HBH54_105580 [Parastagonospora nodorum]KAH3968168.1 hypothetical protein HBH51_133180 [Parastagonospora nodorum]KAH3977360.1 hypothetical protein HBH52_114680 [Parastagonospora nodorum]